MACVYKIDGKIFRTDIDIQNYINSKYSSNGKITLGKMKDAFITLASVNGKTSTRTARHEALHFILEHMVEPQYREKIMSEASATMDERGLKNESYTDIHEFLADSFMNGEFVNVGDTTKAVLTWQKDAVEFLQENPSIVNGFFLKIDQGFYSDAPVLEMEGNRMEFLMQMENGLNDESTFKTIEEHFGSGTVPKVFEIANNDISKIFNEEMSFATPVLITPTDEGFEYYQNRTLSDAFKTYIERKRRFFVNNIDLLNESAYYETYDSNGKMIKEVAVNVNEMVKGNVKAFKEAYENSKKVPVSKVNEQFMKLYVKSVIFNTLEPADFKAETIKDEEGNETKKTQNEVYKEHLEYRSKIFATLMQSVMPGINVELKLNTDESGLVDAKMVVRDKDGETKSRTASENFSSYMETINSNIPMLHRVENEGAPYFTVAENEHGDRVFLNHQQVHGMLKANAIELKRLGDSFTLSRLLDHIKAKYSGVKSHEAAVARSIIAFFGNGEQLTTSDELMQMVEQRDEDEISEARVGMLDLYNNHENNISRIQELKEEDGDPFYDNMERVLETKYKEFRGYTLMLEAMYNSDAPRVYITHVVSIEDGQLKLNKSVKNKLEAVLLEKQFKALAYDFYNNKGSIVITLGKYLNKKGLAFKNHIQDILEDGNTEFDASVIAEFLSESTGIDYSAEMIRRKLDQDVKNDKQFLKEIYGFYQFLHVFNKSQKYTIGNSVAKRKQIGANLWDPMIDSFREMNPKFKIQPVFNKWFDLGLFGDMFNTLTDIYKESENKTNENVIKNHKGDNVYANPISSWFADNVFTGSSARTATSMIARNIEAKLDDAKDTLLNKGKRRFSSILNGTLKLESLMIYDGVESETRGFGVREVSQSDKFYSVMNDILQKVGGTYGGLYAFSDTLSDKKYFPYYDYSLGSPVLVKTTKGLKVDAKVVAPALRDRMHYEAQEKAMLDEVWKGVENKEYEYSDPEMKDFIYNNTRHKHYEIFKKDDKKFIRKPKPKYVSYGLSHAKIDKMTDAQIYKAAKNAHRKSFATMVQDMKNAGFFDGKMNSMNKANITDFAEFERVMSLDVGSESTETNKRNLEASYKKIKELGGEASAITQKIKDLGAIEDLSNEQVAERSKLQDQLEAKVKEKNTAQTIADNISKISKKEYRENRSTLAELMLSNDMIVDEGNESIHFHPLLETMYWSHYIVNAEISSLTRGQVSEAKSIVDWIKRGSGLIAPGTKLFPESIKAKFSNGLRILAFEEFEESHGMYDGKTDTIDGQITMNPVLQAMLKSILGDQVSVINTGSAKDVHYNYDIAANNLNYFKGNWFPITSSQVENSEYYRTALRTMLGKEFYAQHKNNIKKKEMSFQESINEIAETILRSPKNNLADQMVSMIVPESAIKQGIRKLNKFSSKGDSPSISDMSVNRALNSDKNTFFVSVDGMRMQQVTTQEIFDANTSLPSQILNIVGGTKIRLGIKYFANDMRGLIENLTPEDLIKQIIQNEIMKNPEYSKALEILNDPTISNDVVAKKLSNIVGSYISKQMRGSLPGSFNIQGAYIGESVDGVVRELAIMGYEYLDSATDKYVDIASQDELKQKFESGDYKIRFRKPEVVMAFNYADKFGINKGTRLIDAMTLSVGSTTIDMHDRKDEMSWDKINAKLWDSIPNSDKLTKDSINDIIDNPRVAGIISDIYDQIAKRKESDTEAYNEIIDKNIEKLGPNDLKLMAKEYGVEEDQLTDTQKKQYAKFLFASSNKRKGEKFGAYRIRKEKKATLTKEESEGRKVVAAMAEYFYNFNKALDVYFVRLPTTGASMGSPARIAAFEWDAQNTIYLNTKKNILDGSDQDGDQLNVFYRAFNDNGEWVRSNDDNAKSWNMQRKYDEFEKKNKKEVAQNRIFEGIEDFYLNPVNYEQILSKIDLESFRESAPENISTPDFPFNPGTAMKKLAENGSGTELVGHGANASTSLAALRDAFESQDNRIKRLEKNEKKKQAENPKYVPEKFTNIAKTNIFDRDNFERLAHMPTIFDFTTKFTNAATDNANEDGLLGRLNINKYTSPIITGILFEGGISEAVKAISGMRIGMSAVGFSGVDKMIPRVKNADRIVDTNSIEYMLVKKITGGKLMDATELTEALEQELSNYEGKIIGADYSAMLPESKQEKFEAKKFMKKAVIAKLTPEVMATMNEFAVLESQIGTEQAINIYKENSNNSLTQDKNGKASKLHKSISADSVDTETALYEKAKYYTPTYRDAYGAWTDEPKVKPSKSEYSLEDQILNTIGSSKLRAITKEMAAEDNILNLSPKKIIKKLNNDNVGSAALEDLRRYASIGEQMRRLNSFLKLYNGIPTSLSEADHMIASLEFNLGMSIGDFLKAKASDEPNIQDQRKFVQNKLQRKYDGYENRTRESFSLFKVLKSRENTISHMHLLKSYRDTMLENTHYKEFMIDGQPIVEFYKKVVTGGTTNLTKENYEAIYAGIDTINTGMFLSSLPSPVLFDSSYNMNNDKHRMQYAIDFVDYYRGIKEDHSQNKFIQKISILPSNIRDMTGVEILDFRQGNSMKGDLQKLYNNEFNMLPEDVREKFSYYQAIVYGFEYRAGSMNNILGKELEEKYSSWNKTRPEITSDELAKSLGYYGIFKDIGLKQNDTVLEQTYEKSGTGYKKEDAAEWRRALDQEIARESGLTRESEIRASYFPKGIMPKGNWKIGKLTSIRSLTGDKKMLTNPFFYIREGKEAKQIFMGHARVFNVFGTETTSSLEAPYYSKLNRRNYIDLTHGKGVIKGPSMVIQKKTEIDFSEDQFSGVATNDIFQNSWMPVSGKTASIGAGQLVDIETETSKKANGKGTFVSKVILTAQENVINSAKDSRLQGRKIPKAARVMNVIVRKLQKGFPNLKIEIVNSPMMPLGSVKGGIVYLNQNKLSYDTPIHELGHVMIAVIKDSNINLYNNFKNEAIAVFNSDSKLSKDVQEVYSDKNKNDQLEEIMSYMIGYGGANILEKNLNRSFIEKVADMIQRVFRGFMNALGHTMNMKADTLSVALDQNMNLGDFGKYIAEKIVNGERVNDISTTELAILDTVQRDSREAMHNPEDIFDVMNQAQSIDNGSNIKNIVEMHRLKVRIRQNNMSVPSDFGVHEGFTEFNSEASIERLENILKSKADQDIYNKDAVIKLNNHIGMEDSEALSQMTFGTTTNDITGDETVRFTPEKLESIAKAVKMDGHSDYYKYSDLLETAEFKGFYDKAFEGYNPIVKIHKTSTGQAIISLYDISSTSITEFDNAKTEESFLTNHYDSKEIKRLGVQLSNSELSARQFGLVMLRNHLNSKGVIIENMGILEIFKKNSKYREIDQVELSDQIESIYNNATAFMDTLPEKLKNVMAPAHNRVGHVNYLDLLMSNYDKTETLSFIPTFYEKSNRSDVALLDMLRARQRDLQFKNGRYEDGTIDQSKYTSYELQDLRTITNAITEIESLSNVFSENDSNMSALTKMFADSNTVGSKEADRAITLIKRANKSVIRKYDKYMKHMVAKNTGVFDWFQAKSGLKAASFAFDLSEKMFEKLMVTDTDIEGNTIRTGHVYWTVDEKLDPIYAKKAQEQLNLDPNFKEVLEQGKRVVELMDSLMNDIIEHQIKKERVVMDKNQLSPTFLDNAVATRLDRSGYKSGMIPISPTKVSAQIARKSGFMKTIKKGWNSFGSSNEMYDDFDTSGANTDNSTFEIADMFIDQFGIKSGTLSDNMPNGNVKSRIINRMGVELVENDNGSYSYKLVDKETNDNISHDLETSLSYFVMSMTRMMHHETVTLPYINSLETLLMDDMENRNRETKPLREFIQLYKLQAMENKREKFHDGATKMDQDIDKGTMTVMKAASFSVMVLNTNVGILSAISNGMKAHIESISTSMVNWGKDKYPLFDERSLLAAHGKLVTDLPKMIQLADQYNVVAGSDFERVSSRYHTRTKHFLVSRYWGNATNFYPDMLARMVVMTAQMIYDGNYDAHILNDQGVVEYDPKKDGRYFEGSKLTPNGKLLARNKVKQLKIDGSFEPVGKFLDTELPNRAYDDRDGEILRYVSDRFVVGAYSNETRSLYTATYFGKIFGMFSQYATTVIQNAMAKKKMSDQGGRYIINETYNSITGKKERVVQWEQMMVEGYFRTFFGIAKAAQEFVMHGKEMKKWNVHEKKNMAKLFVNLITFMAVYAMYEMNVAKDWQEAEDDPTKIPPYRWVKNVKYSASSLLSLLIIVEFIQDPFVLGNIVTRMFQDRFGNINFKNYPFSGQVKQLEELLLMTEDDPVHYMVTQQKIESQKNREIQERRKK